MARTATGTVEFRGTPARWWARITVKDSGGTIRRPWVDLERPDLKDTPEDKKIAKTLARKQAKLASKKSFLGVEQATSTKATLTDFEARWHTLIEKDPDLKTKTVDRYKSSWTQIVAELGKLPVSAITPLRIRQWIWRRREERSVSTVLNDCNALSRFFQDANREKWIVGVNPMRDATVTDAKPRQEHPDAEDIVRYTLDELERLLGADGMPDDFYGVVLVAATTSCRGGEVRGLQFKHLKDPRDGRACVNIVQQAVKETSEGPVALGVPKYGSKRMNPQHSQVAPWLAWWRGTGWAGFIGRQPTDDDFVFPDVDGSMCRPRDPDTLREWAAKAGVPTHFTRADGELVAFNMNSIRHTFASLLGDLEVDGEVLDALMGHKAKSVRARHYMSIPFERKARAVERLVLVLPDRPGVVARADESSRELSREPEPANDSTPQTTLQATGTTASIPARRRVADWCGPRFSKPA
jgi:integrase